MAYLKYYIRKYKGGLSLDSVACHEGQEPSTPEDFVEWFNRDEWEFVPPSIDKAKQSQELFGFFWSGHLRRKVKE